MSDKRIPYISFLQIIGPVYVILGHSINGINITGWWYVFSKEWIYIFHMPLFFFISGYLLSFRGYLKGHTYKEFILGKTMRLLVPYLFWNLLFYVPKVMAQAYISESVPSKFYDMLKIFVFPRQNVWGHTWFLVGLFVIYAMAPVFAKILTTKRMFINVVIIAICIVIYILPITTEFLALSDLHKDLLFFVIGCMLGQMSKDVFVYRLKKLRFVLIIFAVITSVITLLWYNYTKILHFIPCTCILLAFLSIAVGIKIMPKTFEKLAKNSFAIYILHWPVMIVARVILYQILNLGAIETVIAMSVLGWMVPILFVDSIRKLPWVKFKKPLTYLIGV